MISTTVTIPKSNFVERATLELTLRPSTQVNGLLDEMKRAIEGLPHEHQEEIRRTITEFESIFFNSYNIDSQVDEERIPAAHALLFLRLSHIQLHIIGLANNVKEKVKWVQFSNKIKEIVTKLLQHTDIDAFIEADKKKQLELRSRYLTALVLNKILPEIIATFERIEDELYERVNQVNQDVQHRFEALKCEFEKINDERAESIGELHPEFDALVGKIAQIYQDLQKQLEEMKDRDEIIETKKAVFMHMLDECENVIKKV